jgi:hypothetical protein
MLPTTPRPYEKTYRICRELPMIVILVAIFAWAVPAEFKLRMGCAGVVAVLACLVRILWQFFKERRAVKQAALLPTPPPQ